MSPSTASDTARGSPPAWRQAAAVGLGFLAAVVLGYALVVTQQPLAGVLAFAGLLAVAAAAWYGHRSAAVRPAITWFAMIAVALYGLFARQFPLAVVAAAVVYLVAWVTGPSGPWSAE